MRTSLLIGQSEEGAERHPLPSSPLSKDTFRGVQWVALPIHHCICHDRISDIKHLHDRAQVVYLFNRYLAQRDSKDQMCALLFAVSLSFSWLLWAVFWQDCFQGYPDVIFSAKSMLITWKADFYCATDRTALWSTTRMGTPIGKAITDDNSYVYDFIREDHGYFERFRIYFTLHVWRERMSEDCKSQLSTRGQKGLTVLCQLAWGNDVYFDSWEFNTQIWYKTQTSSTIYVQHHSTSGAVDSWLYLLNPGLRAAVRKLIGWEHLSAGGACEEAGDRVGLGPCINLWTTVNKNKITKYGNKVSNLGWIHAVHIFCTDCDGNLWKCAKTCLMALRALHSSVILVLFIYFL